MTEEAAPGLPKPGPAHDLLKPFEGTFRAKVTIYFGPDQKQESTGTMVNRFELDGLYLHQDYKGDPNDGPFPSFLGKGYWGFNTATGLYEGFWIDNGSTMMQMETGTVADDQKTWEMKSSFKHPQTGNIVHKRSLITLTDQDNHSMVSYFGEGDAAEMKTMEIQYSRES